MTRRRQGDLHGLDVLTALAFARRLVQEGFANGYDEVELVHGAADVSVPIDEGRGRIKWELRAMLERGELDRWADRSRSWPRAASLVVALRHNPRPRREHWSPAPLRRPRRSPPAW